MTRVLLVVWLAVAWVLLWGTPLLANFAGGLVLAVLLVLLFPPSVDRHVGFHPVAVVVYGAHFGLELVKATFSVVLTVLRPSLQLEEAIVGVQLRAASPVVVTFVANSISLTPGTLTVDVRPSGFGVAHPYDQPPMLYIHCLVLGDPEDIHAGVLDFERLAVAAFGTPDDRAAVLGASPP